MSFMVFLLRQHPLFSSKVFFPNLFVLYGSDSFSSFFFLQTKTSISASNARMERHELIYSYMQSDWVLGEIVSAAPVGPPVSTCRQCLCRGTHSHPSLAQVVNCLLGNQSSLLFLFVYSSDVPPNRPVFVCVSIYSVFFFLILAVRLF